MGDVGTFSLLGKSFAIVATVILSRAVLRKRQTPLQYVLVLIVFGATVAFCNAEQTAHLGISGSALVHRDRDEWMLGIAQRTVAVCLTSLGAVLQESLLTRDSRIGFMTQQVWMGISAMFMSVFTLRFIYGQHLQHLLIGFNDLRVIFLLLAYTATGLLN